ncbi:hypothetical protein JRO89_XS02G0016100 [Xanthoceras sorbifolium]|uniref:Trafficking protein particle complex subunit 2-like protein n=2 Tax=rosids TaxID=71275 RepID=A0ABQ8IE35_9ROSI|nr:hypothetical protein JRO89_XS02G0016100 [Xanthoceras sorbifolium]
MIVCVAVVGHQNNPLYIQSFTEADDALKLHHIVHCSLDVVDERVNNPKKSGPTLNETFLGLLYPTENYKVYGYLTNTKVKFILVTTDLDVRDADVRNVILVRCNNARCHSRVNFAFFGALFDNFQSMRFELQDSYFAFHLAFSEMGNEHTSLGFHLISYRFPLQFNHLMIFFRRFHAAYVDAVSNPFHVPGKKITSKTFAERVSTIVKSFGLSSAG